MVAMGRRIATCAVALATPEEIDGINILQASLLAMRRAVEAQGFALEETLVREDWVAMRFAAR